MQSSENERLLGALARLVDALAMAVGKNCEVVLHDLRNPERSIAAIANGHVTGRKVGDTLDALGFQLLRRPPIEDLLNYQSKTKDGRMLRSSSIFLRDESGEIFGAVCVNMDVTVPLKFDEWLRDMIDKGTADLDEKFEHSIDEVLEGLTRSAIRATGKNLPSELTREDKISVISHLDAKGAFLIRYSIDHVAKLLEISKYTIYSYLEEIKSKRANPESTGAALAEK